MNESIILLLEKIISIASFSRVSTKSRFLMKHAANQTLWYLYSKIQTLKRKHESLTGRLLFHGRQKFISLINRNKCKFLLWLWFFINMVVIPSLSTGKKTIKPKHPTCIPIKCFLHSLFLFTFPLSMENIKNNFDLFWKCLNSCIMFCFSWSFKFRIFLSK